MCNDCSDIWVCYNCNRWETDERCQICSAENICSNEDEDMNEDDKENNKQMEKVIKKEMSEDEDMN